MTIEARGRRYFLYDARRVNGRVVKRYAGGIDPASAALLIRRSAVAAEQREAERFDARAAADRAAAVVAALDPFDRLADKLFHVVMRLTGHTLHNRGEWRLPWRNRSMARETLKQLRKVIAGAAEYIDRMPKPGLIQPMSDDPAEQEVLDRAAAGDRDALEAVRTMLKDPRKLSWLGGAATMAEGALVAQVSGDNLAMAEATSTKLRQHITSLLADAGPTPTFAERMLATRAGHCWLAVHVLEVQSTRHAYGSAAALGVAKQLALAERRLNASLKSLAALRRLNRPDRPVTQINVAAPGGAVAVNAAG